MTHVNPLIDIGANLTGAEFRSDLSAVLDRAKGAGVQAIVVTGTTVAGSHDAHALSLKHPGYLYATAGVHPHHARDFDARSESDLVGLLAHPEVLAVGECGLDYNRNYSPPAAQRSCFDVHLGMAAQVRKPLFLHERDAHDDFISHLRTHHATLPNAVVHCFTGDERALDAYLSLGLYIGITGWVCDERRGLHLRDLLKRIPPDRLMLETDAPYLLPRTLRPRPSHRRNEPAFLPAVLATVADALERSPADVAHETTQTARAFFGLSNTPV